MPSTIGQTAGGTEVAVGANYLVAKPSTRFATRDLSFCVVGVTGIQTDYEDSDSVFSQVVRAVQLQAEIYAVGTPSAGYVTIAVTIDTANDGDNISETPGNPAQNNSMAKTISEALTSAGITNTVAFKKLVGNGFGAQNITLWSTDGSTAG
jgi:hypothetical protein